ncbi:MAG: lysophospholipid acyltransferase family protein [Planctomycetales bacterium]|jgi:1-acyl-sn-glycerol-3-phosphate acyltransferase
MSTPAIPSPYPTRRNIVWLALQYTMRLVYMLWLRYQVRGLENVPNTGGGLVLVNHQSFLDPTLVGVPLQRPVSYLARDSLFRVPIIGWVLRNTYVIPINRDAPGTASIRKALQRMNDGFLVGLFPEGTRSLDGNVGEFKPGFISLIRRAKVPVYPVGIAGAHEAMPRGGVRFWPQRVRVVFGEPLDAEEVARLSTKGHEDELVAFVRSAVEICQLEAQAWRDGTSGKST